MHGPSSTLLPRMLPDQNCEVLSVYTSLFFGALCFVTSIHLILLILSGLSPCSGTLLGTASVSLPTLRPSPSFKSLAEGIHRSHFIYFLLLRDHSSSLPDVQCVINQCLIYLCLLFVVGVVLVNPVPVLPSWSKAEISNPVNIFLKFSYFKRKNDVCFCSFEQCI